MGEPQIAQIKESFVFPEKYCHLLDKKNNKTKHKYLSQMLKVAQHMLCKRVHLYSARFKSLSLWPALGMFFFFF